MCTMPLACYSGGAEGADGVQYKCTFEVPACIEQLQPFGMLGGMPHTCAALGLYIPMGRLRTDYTLQQLQNAHVIVLGERVTEEVEAGVPNPNSAALQQCVHAAGVDATAAAALFGATAGYAEQLAALGELDSATYPSPDWLKQARGPQGTQLRKQRETLVARQRHGHAFEAALHASLPDDAVSTLSSFAVLRFAKWTGLRALRTLAVDETAHLVTAMKKATSTARATAQAEYRDIKYEAYSWALKAKIQSLDADLDAFDTRDFGHLTNNGGSTDVITVGMDLLFMPLVVAHPGSKGAGQAIMAGICALADELKRPIVLEALLLGGLPLFYAQRYKFQAVTLHKHASNFTDTVIMARLPQAPAADPPSAASTTVMAAWERATIATTVLDYNGKHDDIRAELRLQLSALTTKLIRPLYKRMGDAVLWFATWAAQYDRQVVNGELISTLGNREDPPPRPAAPAPAAAAATAGAGAMHTTLGKRPRDDDDDDAKSVATDVMETLQPQQGMVIKRRSGEQVIFHFTNCQNCVVHFH